MAVGNIVGVEPLDNGAYNFVDKGGKKMTLFGPEAEDLAQRFRASDELQRGTKPTAQVTQEDLVQGAGGFGGFGGQVTQPNIATDAPAPVPGLEGPPASIARQTESPPQQQQQGAAAANRFSTGKPGETMVITADGKGYVETTTAPSKGGLVEKSRSVSGGFEQDKDYLKATEQSFRGQAESQAKGAEIAVNEAQVEQAYLAQQQRQNAMRIEQQQAQQKTIEDGIRAKQAEYDLINESYKAQKVDPWRGMGTGQKIGLALFGALGAFGAGMAKSPNFVQAMIDGYIERQIREQEREIAVKREQAQNTLADLEKKLGNRDLAKTALSAMLTERTQLQLQNMTASLKAPKIVAAFQDANAKLTQQYADKLEEYRQKAGGQITKSIVNVPGSAGGTSRRDLTMDEVLKTKKVYEQPAPKQGQGVGSERTTKIADNAQAITQGQGVLKLLEDEGSSEFWEPGTPGVRSIPGTDQYEQSNKLEQETEALVTTTQKASGIGSTEDDRGNVVKGIVGGGSVQERRRGAESIIKQSAARIAAEIATLPPEQQQVQMEALAPEVRAHVAREMAR